MTIREAEQFYSTWRDWLGIGLKPVPKHLAQKRADQCMKCPMRSDDTSLLKETVASAVRAQIELKNKENLRVDGEKSLGVCSACRCVLRLKVWCPMQTIKANTDEETFKSLHPDCWQLKETE